MAMILPTHIESIESKAVQIARPGLAIADHNVAPGMVVGLHSFQPQCSARWQVWEMKIIHLAMWKMTHSERRLHKAHSSDEGFHWEECNQRQCDGSSTPQEHQ